MKRLILSVLTVVLFASSAAHAIPVLQLYIEGATYDMVSESWVWDGVIGVDPVRLWVIGNVAGPGGHGPILDVKLSAVYFNTGYVPTLTLTPTTMGAVGSYGGFTDPSTPIPVSKTFAGHNTAGGTPTLGDGSSLPSHGEFGPTKAWQEWSLGDFDLTDSPMGDFIYNFPTPSAVGQGQINVYDINISPYDFAMAGQYIHFDAYNHVEGENHARFAPFSHDASIPEPGTLALVGLGLAGLGARLRRKR